MVWVLATLPRMNTLAFIGGGNMASAIVGGLLGAGSAAGDMLIVEPWAEQRAKLEAAFPGVAVRAAADQSLASANVVVWAVKPQQFGEAALKMEKALFQPTAAFLKTRNTHLARGLKTASARIPRSWSPRLTPAAFRWLCPRNWKVPA